MKYKLKLLLILIVIAAIGIVGVLASWLYGSYHQRLSLFISMAEHDLFNTVQEVFQEESAVASDSILSPFSLHMEDDLAKIIQQRKIPISNEDLRGVLLELQQKQNGHRKEILKKIKERLEADNAMSLPSMENGRPRLLFPGPLLASRQVNQEIVEKIEKRFASEFLKKNPGSNYDIQVVSSPQLFDPHDSMGKMKKNQLQIRPFLINSETNQFITIRFHQPWRYLLYALSWQLVASISILAVIVGTFVYLFLTIFRQNKMDILRKSFMDSLTHELRTPIATVNVALDAMQHFVDSNDHQLRATYCEMAKEELDHLSNTIDRVLEISKREGSPSSPIDIEPFDFLRLTKKMVTVFQQTYMDKGIIFVVESTGEDYIVRGDAHHMKNVLNNLLDNAVKYGATAVNIKLEEISRREGIKIVVSDNGIGIPEAYHDQVFETFFRVPRGNLYSVKGFGLGLTYVKQIVKLHNGTIHLRNNADAGCSFAIFIPKTVKK